MVLLTRCGQSNAMNVNRTRESTIHLPVVQERTFPGALLSSCNNNRFQWSARSHRSSMRSRRPRCLTRVKMHPDVLGVATGNRYTGSRNASSSVHTRKLHSASVSSIRSRQSAVRRQKCRRRMWLICLPKYLWLRFISTRSRRRQTPRNLLAIFERSTRLPLRSPADDSSYRRA